MKVALVHELLHKFGGAERVLYSFTKLFPDAPIYTLLYDQEKVGNYFPPSQVITSPLQKYFRFLKKPQLFINKMPEAIESFDFSNYDLVLSSSSGFTHGLLTPLKTRHICYCHSPMRYAWDYTNEYRQEKRRNYFGFLQDWLISKSLLKIRQWDQITADRPDVYLANSQNVRKRLHKYYNIDAKVIYPPVNINNFHPTPSNQKKEYFLIVSALSPFKKIDLAIKAFNKIKKELYIIGDGQDSTYLKNIADNNIKFLGRQSDLTVKKYMEEARGLLFPGEDDFGITPIEALSAGTPVLAFNKGGATETISPSQTGELFNKQTTLSFLNGLDKFNNNYHLYKTINLRAKAEEFSEKIFLENIKKVIQL